MAFIEIRKVLCGQHNVRCTCTSCTLNSCPQQIFIVSIIVNTATEIDSTKLSVGVLHQRESLTPQHDIIAGSVGPAAMHRKNKVLQSSTTEPLTQLRKQ